MNRFLQTSIRPNATSEIYWVSQCHNCPATAGTTQVYVQQWCAFRMSAHLSFITEAFFLRLRPKAERPCGVMSVVVVPRYRPPPLLCCLRGAPHPLHCHCTNHVCVVRAVWRKVENFFAEYVLYAMSLSCLHRGIGRPKAEQLLLEAGKDGSFLVRESETVSGGYTLCLL